MNFHSKIKGGVFETQYTFQTRLRSLGHHLSPADVFSIFNQQRSTNINARCLFTVSSLAGRTMWISSSVASRLTSCRRPTRSSAGAQPASCGYCSAYAKTTRVLTVLPSSQLLQLGVHCSARICALPAVRN